MKIAFRRVRVVHLSQTRRALAVLISLAGAACFFAGQVEAHTDRRFLLLAAGGFGLMVAGFVMAQRNCRRI